MVQFHRSGPTPHQALPGLAHHALDRGLGEAKACLADHSLNDGNPFEAACRPDLLNEAVGTAIKVDTAVTTGSVPRALSSFFSTSAPDVHPDARHAAD